MSTYTVAEIASRIDAEVQGDPATTINVLSPLESARPGSVSFLTNSRYLSMLAETKASAVVLTHNDSAAFSGTTLVTDNVSVAQAKLASMFSNEVQRSGIHPTAVVAPTAVVPSSAFIGPYCVLEDNVIIGARSQILAHCVLSSDVHLGDDCLIHPHVTFYPGVKLGDRCIIHSATVLGSDGLGLANDNGRWLKIAQLGSVLIGDDVEIGASCSIDRGAITDTVISSGVKLDNQVHLGHNVTVGENTVMAGCTGVAGSVKIGKNCMFGGQVGVSGHLDIADGAVFTAQSGVTKSVKEPGFYSSTFSSCSASKWRRLVARLMRLDELFARVKKLEKGHD